MKIIETDEALAALRAAGQHPQALLDLIADRRRTVIAAYAEADWNWDPAEHGAFAILEEGDGPVEFDTIGLNPEGGLLEACWESCQAHTGPERAYEVLHLFSNDGGWTIFVPMDAKWLSPALRAKLDEEAVQQTHPGRTGEPPF